ATMEMTVVLPAPFGPSSAKISPRSMSRSTPARATNEPKVFWTPRMETTGSFIGRAECSASRGRRHATRRPRPGYTPCVGRRDVPLSDEDRWVFNRLAPHYGARPPYPSALAERLAAIAG